MADDGTREVIVHVSHDPTDIQRALDAADALRAADPRTRVQIIANGEALNALTGTAGIDVPEGVVLTACATGLARRGIEPADVPPAVQSTPSAVTAIVEGQLAGALYVRL